MLLPSEISAVEQRLEWLYDDTGHPSLVVEVKRLPSGQTVSRVSSDFWRGVWATDDGRYFVVMDREVLWFDTRDIMLNTMSSLLRSKP